MTQSAICYCTHMVVQNGVTDAAVVKTHLLSPADGDAFDADVVVGTCAATDAEYQNPQPPVVAQEQPQPDPSHAQHAAAGRTCCRTSPNFPPPRPDLKTEF